ncbi:MAG: type II toxin-antitoxin system Phd/YefM family antitoxin [Verrucomicrobiales bacterium]|nr:type II toxin-antitoxin system Phd/YefM family antitoxin [Verrucomicrobiales bacterium]
MMKTVSIRELHQSTGEIVRTANQEPALVTDRGRPIAIIKAITAADMTGQALPKGHWQSLPRPTLCTDSTATVSEDRGNS